MVEFTNHAHTLLYVYIYVCSILQTERHPKIFRFIADSFVAHNATHKQSTTLSFIIPMLLFFRATFFFGQILRYSKNPKCYFVLYECCCLALLLLLLLPPSPEVLNMKTKFPAKRQVHHNSIE